MSKKQLWLYVGILIILFDSSGLLAVLPDYAQKLGATPALAGYYLAFGFLTLAIGTFVAPAIARRFSNFRLVMILLSAAQIPLIFLCGQAINVWQLIFLNGLNWFLAGILSVIINVSVGLQAGPNERGKVFGILGVGTAVGGLFGGILGSALLAQNGYPVVFTVFAAVACLAPLMALTLMPISAHTTVESAQRASAKPSVNVASDGPVDALVAAATATRFATFVGVFGLTIIMLSQKYTPSEISFSGVAGSLSAIVTPVVLGRLSDRLGRKALLIACYMAGLIGTTLLVFGAQLWHFMLVFAIRGVYFGGVPVIGSALLTDMAPRDRLPRALAWWGNSGWVGGVLAYAFTGNSIELFGIGTTLWLAVALMAAATAVTAWLLWRKPARVAVSV